MPTGRVRWFDAAKGYGFIASEKGEDVFLPAAALPAGTTTLRKNAKVEYAVIAGRRGPQAMDVKLIASGPSMVKANRPKTLSRCWILQAIRCVATITRLLPRAVSWRRCCVQWPTISTYRTD